MGWGVGVCGWVRVCVTLMGIYTYIHIHVHVRMDYADEELKAAQERAEKANAKMTKLAETVNEVRRGACPYPPNRPPNRPQAPPIPTY